MVFGGSCDVASGTFRNADGSSGIDAWQRVITKRLSIAPANPIIPGNSRAQNRRVLTRSDLTLRVTDNGQPAAGITVAIKSDRPADDAITGPASPTDSTGTTSAQVETRSQPGPSTITSATADIKTAIPGVIEWLPTHYEPDFLVTCYVISQESDFLSTPLVGPVNGLPATARYRQGFINDVRLQGSGIALDGTTIHYDGRNRYSVQSCPVTTSGVCAVDGTTVAVDPSVTPLGSEISIATVGSRAAQDTGGAITGFHIDEYFGARRAECIRAGRRSLGVDFVSY
jgi:3D (Asp-Asp-Asp) domain-containing protein